MCKPSGKLQWLWKVSISLYNSIKTKSSNISSSIHEQLFRTSHYIKSMRRRRIQNGNGISVLMWNTVGGLPGYRYTMNVSTS